MRSSWRKRRKRKTGSIDLEKIISRCEKFDRQYLDVIVHSVKLYGGDDCEQGIQQFLSKRNRFAFYAVNSYSKQLWVPELLQEFLAIHRRDGNRSWKEALRTDVACALVTFTHRAWASPDTNIAFDLSRAKQMVRNALGGTHFIAAFEPAMYQNEEWRAGGIVGKLVNWHCHAIVWARSKTHLERLRSYIRPRFEPILGNKNGARFDFLQDEHDVADTVGYMAKMNFLGKRTITNGAGKKTQEYTSNISKKTRYRVYDVMKERTIFDYWLAGGQGAKALRTARNNLKKEARRRQKHQRCSVKGIPRKSTSNNPYYQ